MIRVLVLGDGNFSFSLSLAQQLLSGQRRDLLQEGPPSKIQVYLDLSLGSSSSGAQVEITSTSFDSKFQVLEKYKDAAGILEKLEKFASVGGGSTSVRVLHEINAWDLKTHFPNEFFDLIVWNHPHLGTEDFRLHQFLMAHFFHSCTQVLNWEANERAAVRLSLVQGQESRWNVIKQAKKVNLYLSSLSLFNELDWPGYVVKRNKHGGSFKNIHTKRHVRTAMKSCVYSFTRSAQSPDHPLFSPESVHAHLGLLFGSDTFDDIFTSKPLLAAPAPSLDLTPPKPHPNPRKRDKQPPPPGLVCLHCQKQLSTPRGYHQHVHTVHELQKFGADWRPDRARTFSCGSQGCEKKFVDKEALAQHMVNKHTSIPAPELAHIGTTCAVDADAVKQEEYQYVACHVCGQSCINQEWGIALHLESLKPAVGMDMKCPLCVGRGFIEQRALLQHYKFCRLKLKTEEVYLRAAMDKLLVDERSCQ